MALIFQSEAQLIAATHEVEADALTPPERKRMKAALDKADAAITAGRFSEFDKAAFVATAKRTVRSLF